MTTTRFMVRVALPVLMVGIGAAGCESKASESPPKEGAAPAAKEAAPVAASKSGPISVVSATFGKACGAAAGNHTERVAEQCNGQEKCAFFVTNPGVDPFPGCAKDFVAQYRCGKDGEVRNVEHAALAGENYTVNLTCL